MLAEIEKKIISTVSRKDGNFQICVPHPDAARLCERARLTREGMLSKKKQASEAMKSLVCVDEMIVCQGGRWYWDHHHPHVVPFAALNNFETYNHGELNLTYEKAVKEAYANYQVFGNDMRDNFESWGMGHVTGNGLRMPICQSQYLKIKDFSSALPHQREDRQWQFPGICGSLGKETEQFLEAIDAEYRGKTWDTRSAWSKNPLSLWSDRMPRVSPLIS